MMKGLFGGKKKEKPKQDEEELKIVLRDPNLPKEKPKKPEPVPEKKPEKKEENPKKEKHGFSLFGRKKDKPKEKKKEKKKPEPKKKDKKKEKNAKKKRGFHLFGRKKDKPKAKKDDKKKDGGKKKKPKLPLPRINLIPRAYENWVEKQLFFSGSERTPKKAIMNMLIVSLIISVAAGLFLRSHIIYVLPGTFAGIFLMFNAMLSLSVDRRGRFVDEILPDALLLLSANIRAGYIPSRALILSARKEFGPLSVAIRRSGKEIMTGASLEEGLKEIPKKIKSKDLERTIKLIIEGIRGGGQIVTLLEENAIDIRRRQAIRKEISANIMMYAIFIAFAGCLGAPGLYALSGYLTTTMSQLTPDISMTDQISSKVSFIQMSGAQVDPTFLFQFSISAILITTVFGGLILGLINSGREKDGLKYAPILAIIALAVFFAASFVVNTMFSAILPS